MKIENGLNKIKEAHKRLESGEATAARQWRDLKNKIDSILKSSHRKTDEVKVICTKLDESNHEDRCRIIVENWGEQYLNKVMPLLQQLRCLEEKS